MDELGCVNLFVSEGAGVETILAELQSRGEEVQRDAFGHVKLDAVNPGAWFGKQFANRLGAEKTMVQKSGYFSRSAPSNSEDLALIKRCTDLAAEVALDGGSGVIGQDEERSDELRAIEFPRIKGGKPFDTAQAWFGDLLGELGQPLGEPVAVQH
jgi:diphosphate-dependent phosphofructokinase